MRRVQRIILWVCAVSGGITLCLAAAITIIVLWYWPHAPKAPDSAVETPPWGSLSAIIEETRSHGGTIPPLIGDASKGPSADGKLRVLVMSAGGQYGAFGAGVLSGWTRTNYRPYFDVVTGLSVGGILAPIAFLGPEHDKKLKALVQEIADEVDRHPLNDLGPLNLLRAVWGHGFRVSEGIEHILRQFFDEGFLDLVAQEYANGRRLYVGSTDVTAGRVVIWDLGAIASSKRPDRVQRFQDAIIASISVPVAMPATYIESGQAGTYGLHVDGSFLAPIFITTLIGSYDKLNKSFEVYVVVNNRLRRPQPLELVTPRLVDLIPRLFYLVHTSQFERSMDLLLARSQLHNFTVRILAIPEEKKLPFSLNFSGQEMTDLYKLGETTGEHNESWVTLPPDGLPDYWAPSGAALNEAERKSD